MNILKKLLIALFGNPNALEDSFDVSTPDVDEDEAFQYYNTFNLNDGHLLASELKKLEIDFRVEINDGISSVDERFGSAGARATMCLYIEEEYRDILDDLVRLHFHHDDEAGA